MLWMYDIDGQNVTVAGFRSATLRPLRSGLRERPSPVPWKRRRWAATSQATITAVL